MRKKITCDFHARTVSSEATGILKLNQIVAGVDRDDHTFIDNVIGLDGVCDVKVTIREFSFFVA